MKKLLAIVLTLIIALSLGVTVVSAASSPEAEGVVSSIKAEDVNGQNISINVDKIDGKVSSTLQNGLAGVKKESGNKGLKIVDHFEVAIEGEPSFPITVSLSVFGIKRNSTVYILAEDGDSAPDKNKVTTIKTTVEDGKIIFKLEKNIKKFAIVTDAETAQVVEKENNVKSPQTADNVNFVALAMMVAVGGIVFVSKKVKA